MKLLVFASALLSVFLSDAQPTDREREVWNQVNAVLQESESILSGLQAYKGAGQEIRDVRLPCPQMLMSNSLFFQHFSGLVRCILKSLVLSLYKMV